jgi:preprotein translocase subunit YajC
LRELVIPLLAEGDGVGGSFLVPLILVGLIFYFIVIRPGSRERKQREAQLSSLKKHDKVITNAGIHATVVALDDDTVTLRVDEKNNVRIRFSRAAIWQVLGDEDEKPTGKSEK